MTRKMNQNFMFVIAVSILLSVLLTAIVSYRLFQQEVFAGLSSCAKMIEQLGLIERMKEDGYVQPENELRITWIGEDGSVLYDSYTPAIVSTDHSSRPEVMDAQQNGEGYSIRKSQTMDESIFFYAKRADNGTIIRMAKETGSILQVYKNILPAVFFIALFSFLISAWIARKLVKAFVRPIAQMADDMSHLENVDAYKELTPFVELIREQHEEVKQNARIRQEFTANVSHELKTPLTAISGYAELIANGMATKKESRHFAEEIHENAQRLLKLINDILALSELDDVQGHTLSLERVNVYEIARQCIHKLEPVAAKHEVCLLLEGEPLLIDADRELLAEMIYNLCDNAIRYNKNGGNVWVSVTDRLSVRDNGIGISPQYQKRVFERFFRVDKSRSKKTGGTGLGLAIVKHIAQAHRACIALESEEGVGTTISVMFPGSASALEGWGAAHE